MHKIVTAIAVGSYGRQFIIQRIPEYAVRSVCGIRLSVRFVQIGCTNSGIYCIRKSDLCGEFQLAVYIYLRMNVDGSAAVPPGVNGSEFCHSIAVGVLDAAAKSSARVVLCTKIPGIGIAAVVPVFVAMPEVYSCISQNITIVIHIADSDTDAEWQTCFALIHSYSFNS